MNTAIRSDQEVPSVVRAAADSLFDCAVSWVEQMVSFAATPEAGRDPAGEADEAGDILLASYFALCAAPNNVAHQRFHAAARNYDRALCARVEQARGEGTAFTDAIKTWRGKWSVYNRLWQAWSTGASPFKAAAPAPRIIHLDLATPSFAPARPAGPLTADQQTAVRRLLGLLHGRTLLREAGLPDAARACWSVPLLLGSDGSGKMRLCEEVARCWGDRPCRRWELAHWGLCRGYGADKTTESLNAFVKANPGGCVVYLAGMENLTLHRQRYVDYQHAVIGEISQFLDSTLRVRSGLDLAAPLVVFGGDYPAMWSPRQAMDNDAATAWKSADDGPTTEPAALAKWLREESGLPAELVSRFGSEPLLLRPLNEEEATRLVIEFHRQLPPAFDGIEIEELSAALRQPRGWHALLERIEWTFADSVEEPPSLDAGAKNNDEQIKAKLYSPRTPKKARLHFAAHRVRRSTHASALLARAAQLGIDSATLERLAQLRGYTIPGERLNTAIMSAVSVDKFNDLDVLCCLLSNGLEGNTGALCRAALVLRALLTTATLGGISLALRRERVEEVARHIALLGHGLEPQNSRWCELLAHLPLTGPNSPGFTDESLPDDAILGILRRLLHS